MIVNKIPFPYANRIDIDNATASMPDFDYTGNVQSGSASLVLTYSGDTLVEGTDYITTGEKTATNAGTYTFIVTGIGAYTGQREITWTIQKVELRANYIAGYTVRTGYSDGYSNSWSRPYPNVEYLLANYAANLYGKDISVAITITPDDNDPVVIGTATYEMPYNEGSSIANNYYSSPRFYINESGQLVFEGLTKVPCRTIISGVTYNKKHVTKLSWESTNHIYTFMFEINATA